jgi:P27 family predicted phage terminase small subunit
MALKLLRGNPGQRRIRPEPMPAVPATVPEPPAFIVGDAAEEWWRLAPELHRLGLLTTVDLMPFAAYCWAYSCWREAMLAIADMAAAEPETKGLTITRDRGQRIQNPLVGVARRAAADMLDYAMPFGLTPVARTRIAAGVCQPPGKFAGMIED